MPQMRLGIDSNGHVTYKIGKFPGYILNLPANTEMTVTVPSIVDPKSGLKINGVLISNSKAVDILYKNGTTPISTTDGPTDDQTQNPSLRAVKAGDTLRFYSFLASVVQLEWIFTESAVWN